MDKKDKDLTTEIFKKLDILDMRIDSIDKTMVKQEANLAEHMRRSDALEHMLMQVQREMKPVEKHVIMVEGAMKFLGIISIGISIVGGLLKVFGVL